MKSFGPSTKRKIKYKVLNPALYAEIVFRKILPSKRGSNGKRLLKLQRQLNLYKFIEKTWHLQTIADLIDLIAYVESLNRFEKLHTRFQFWKLSLSELNKGI